MKRKPLTCPDCGVTMNHHAEKLAEPYHPEDWDHVDLVLGGIIEEAHTCPECGKGHSRSRRMQP